jgi:hypothetical protein
MGLINEFGTEQSVGAVQGGTGKYLGALGTFTQNPPPASGEGAAATPAPDGFRATFDLILPNVSA